MRTSERLRKLKAWFIRELCEGRMLKAPAPDFDVMKIERKEPECFLAWTPTRPDQYGRIFEEPMQACPSIILMPKTAHVKYTEEKRFDRYNNIHRAQELGQTLSIDALFSVYEPGIRMPGFIDSADERRSLDMTLLREGTEEGLFTLMNWMDDCMEKLLGQKCIPGTDLFVNESSMVYSL